MDFSGIKSMLPDVKKIGMASLNQGPKNKVSFEQAVIDYQSFGGVVKMDSSIEGSPKLLYPHSERLISQLSVLDKKIAYLNAQIGEYTGMKRAKTIGDMKSSVIKFKEPSYWKHLIQLGADAKYREQYKKIRPPMNKFDDPRWGAVAREFVKSSEYRNRLYEAKTSIIGEKSGSITGSISKTEQHTGDLMDRRLVKLRAELESFVKKRDAISSILNFCED
ncbi:MAG: hypothetical protein V1911_02375 [Candidatus Micrarchaeota archaeon]